MDSVFWLVLIIFAVGAVCVNMDKRKLEQSRRHKKVELGMPEDKMLEIMGGGYSRRLLTNNRVEYEWHINESRFSGVMKVTIYTKDGRVEEVKPYYA